MTTTATTLRPESDFDVRWREWQLKGQQDDRRREVITRGMGAVIATGLIIWLSVMLLSL